MDNRRRNDFNKLSREQKLELARALFQRGSDAYTAAKAAFQKVYPTAPDEMIDFLEGSLGDRKSTRLNSSH